MHTREISRITSDAVSKVSAGEMAPENAKAISDLCRTEISNWRAQLEYARHTGRVASIPELEEPRSVTRKAA
jgi:hypothetical protein